MLILPVILVFVVPQDKTPSHSEISAVDTEEEKSVGGPPQDDDFW